MDRLNDSDFIMDRPDDLTTQLKIQEEIIHNILGTKEVTQRIKRLKLSKDINSPDALKKARALNRVIAQGNLAQIPAAQDLNQVMESTFRLISEQIARNFVQNRIEEKVQEALIDRQDEYIEEMRMNVIRKEKGPENSKTRKKYQDLVDLDQIHLSRNILNQLRPQEFNEIIGQERAIRSLISKIASPYPQHIILYGPPGVGKTTAARIALEEAKS